MTNRLDKEDINALAIIKGDERYIVLYESTEQSRGEAMRTLGRWAVNKGLSFTWYDAALLCSRIRKEAAASA